MKSLVVLMFSICLPGFHGVARADQTEPGDKDDKIVISVHVDSNASWPAAAAKAIQVAREELQTHLTASGFTISGPRTVAYTFSISIHYTGISQGTSEYGWRLQINGPDGKLLDSSEGGSFYRGSVYVSPLIGPYAMSVVRHDPAPLVALLMSSLSEGYQGVTTSSAVAIALGHFGTPKVVDALVEAMNSKLVTASNARFSLIKISKESSDPAVRRMALEALNNNPAK